MKLNINAAENVQKTIKSLTNIGRLLASYHNLGLIIFVVMALSSVGTNNTKLPTLRMLTHQGAIRMKTPAVHHTVYTKHFHRLAFFHLLIYS